MHADGGVRGIGSGERDAQVRASPAVASERPLCRADRAGEGEVRRPAHKRIGRRLLIHAAGRPLEVLQTRCLRQGGPCDRKSGGGSAPARLVSAVRWPGSRSQVQGTSHLAIRRYCRTLRAPLYSIYAVQPPRRSRTFFKLSRISVVEAWSGPSALSYTERALEKTSSASSKRFWVTRIVPRLRSVVAM